MGYPAGLHILERAGSVPGAPAVVLRARIAGPGREFPAGDAPLPELHIVAYDRRGYQGSRRAGVVGLARHIADLADVLTEVRARGATTVAVIGHSVGGMSRSGPALAEPLLCDSLGAYEPPMPWLGFRRTRPGDDRPGGWSPLAEDPAERSSGSSAAW